MIKVDLITGFLGSGKTTFIKEYVNYLISKGENIGIIENDYGAVNVDMLLLEDAIGEDADLEMVAGGCDYDCHRRRFKTKLIALGMLGYDRVLIEPSGIYDVDEFSRLRKAINLSNLNNCVTTIYTIDEEGKNVDVHCKSTVLLIPQIPEIDNYLRIELNEFFRAHQFVGNEMVKLREKEEAVKQ